MGRVGGAAAGQWVGRRAGRWAGIYICMACLLTQLADTLSRQLRADGQDDGAPWKGHLRAFSEPRHEGFDVTHADAPRRLEPPARLRSSSPRQG